MKEITSAMQNLNRSISKQDKYKPIPFREFLKALTDSPSTVIRSAFQVFHDMIKDEYELIVVYSDGNRYTWSNAHFPFKLTTSFSSGTSLIFSRRSPIPAGITYKYAVPEYAINYYE